MNPPDWRQCSEQDVWTYVAAHLSQRGIDTVLVGGSVVSIYAKGLYRSGDLDLVTHTGRKEVKAALDDIGFIAEGRHFRHPDCSHIFVEFVNPPVAIGDDYQITPDELKIGNHIFKILSPTDCIKDRLASYAYFDARECLDQAILVATRQLFNLDAVQKWCKQENLDTIFEEFLALYKS